MDAQGITDHSSALSFGFSPWSDIAGVSLRSIRCQRLIEVALWDAAPDLARLPRRKQRAVLDNRRPGHASVCIPLICTGVDIRATFPIVETMYRRYGGLHTERG